MAEWRALKVTCARVTDVIGAGVHSHSPQFVNDLEGIIDSGDEKGFYKHLKVTVR